MKRIILILVFGPLISCAQEKQILLGETEFQHEINARFKDAKTSPLKDKDRKDFKGLDFFKFDPVYVVKASLVRTPDEKHFKMKTTTDRLIESVKYGVVEFQIHGNAFKLNIYQDIEKMKKEGNEDYLFLPFLDMTNGDTSYGGGRYIETKISDGNITIDFNTAFNPWCAYDEKYSCPIVPRDNYLSMEVKAGEKVFEKH